VNINAKALCSEKGSHWEGKFCHNAAMKIVSATYVGQANSLEECPKEDWPEFAFIGRSNVGKSSLINFLTNHKGLAKVSTTPGKTRAIHYFNINDKFALVDLPGYGYAKVAKGVDEGFNVAAADYLSQRPQLKCIFSLIDSRHEPQEIDFQYLNWIQPFERNLVLVFTKSDLTPKEKLKANMKAFRQMMRDQGMEVPKTLSCSSKNGAGKVAIFEQIQRCLPKESKDAIKKKKTSNAWLKNIGM